MWGLKIHHLPAGLSFSPSHTYTHYLLMNSQLQLALKQINLKLLIGMKMSTMCFALRQGGKKKKSVFFLMKYRPLSAHIQPQTSSTPTSHCCTQTHAHTELGNTCTHQLCITHLKIFKSFVGVKTRSCAVSFCAVSLRVTGVITASSQNGWKEGLHELCVPV